MAKRDLLYPLFYLMLTLGLRRGEALGLAWDHVDLSAGTVRVAQALVVTGDGNRVELKEVKTTRSRRTLYVQGDAIGVLKSQQETQARHKELLAAGWANEHNLVFTTRLGTPMHPRNLIRTFKRLICRADIRDVSLHDLRHTYASLALHAGVPIELVSERLGHTSVGFTLSTYRHLYASEQHKAALSLTELLGNEEDEAGEAGDDGGEAAPHELDGEEDG